MFKFNFKKLGPVKEGSVTLAPFTIICGRNNVGKTYISHAIYACLLEAKKQLLNLNTDFLHSALKADKEFKLDFDVQTIDIRTKLPSPKAISNKISSELSKDGLAKFFNSEAISKDIKIDFEFNIDIEGLIYKNLIDEQYNLDFANITCHKPINSYELTTTFRRTEGVIETPLGPSFVALAALNNTLNSLVNLDTYIATSERTGIALFQPTFDSLNTQLGRDTYEVKRMRKSTKYLTSSIEKLHSFPKPVMDNIEFIRTREQQNTSKQLKNSSHLYTLFNKLIGGEFFEQSDSLEFKPTGSNISIPFSMASSSSKSVYLIEKFIKKRAKSGSIIIIDEPELNLHIDNQLQMADLLAALVNSDVQVIITTHSDHMLREINMLMMLGSKLADPDEKKDILEEYGFDELSVLNPDKVKAYVVSSKEGKVFDVEKTKYGLNLDLFNHEIIANNRKIRNIQESLFN